MSSIPNNNVSLLDVQESYDYTFVEIPTQNNWPPDEVSLGSFRNERVSFTSAPYRLPSPPEEISLGDDFRNKTWEMTGIASNSNSTSVSGTSDIGIVNAYYRRYLIKIHYSQDILKIRKGQEVIGIQFYISNPVPSAYQPFPNYQISMKNTSGLSPNDDPGTTGWTVTKNASDFDATTSGYKFISFNTNYFTHSGGNIAICIAWGMIPTGYISNGTTYTFNGSSTYAKMFYNQSDGSGAYSNSSSAPYSTTTKIPVINFVTNDFWNVPKRYILPSSSSSHGTSSAGLVNVYYKRYVIKVNYGQSLLNDIGILSGCQILAIEFEITQAPNSGYTDFNNYQVSYKNLSSSDVDTNPGNTGWTVALEPQSLSFYQTGLRSFYWGLTKPIIYTGGTLSFCFAWGMNSGGWNSSGTTKIFTTDSSKANMWYERTDDPGIYTFASDATTSSSNIPFLRFHLGKEAF